MATELLCRPVEDVLLTGGPTPDIKVVDEVEPWRQDGLVTHDGIKPYVTICIPFGGKNPDGTMRWHPPEFTIALRNLVAPPNTMTVPVAIKGWKRDMARNELARESLRLGAKFALLLDDDNPPPPDALLKLLDCLEQADDDVALVAGIYVTKRNPPQPLVFMGEGCGPFWKWKQGQVFECQNIATGCMLVRTDAYRRIPEPWFMDITTPEEGRAAGIDVPPQALHFEMTDDMFFCRKVREAGMKMLAHGGVLPGHWDQQGNVYFLPDDSYPMRKGD